MNPPRTFNEKLRWLNLHAYRDNPLIRQCVDKVAVREYIREKGYGETLNDLIGVWERASDIPWDDLPDKFVLKCNHGSGYNILCPDKTSLNIPEAVRTLDQWMREDFWCQHIEYIYRGIPKRILCERFIKTEDDLPPKDYKVFCSYGVPKLMYVASDRIDHQTKFDFYTVEGGWIPVENHYPNTGRPFPRLDMLPRLKEIASGLAEDFPIVRVDFYVDGERIIFGELTFLHMGGITPFVPDSYDLEFGDLFPLPVDGRRS